jgi:HD-GYP domain-containing protein (c-di-GMP phosphodiesterase class II)
MLKRIDTVDVELGMFIHRLEGNWFRHPFWKARFLLEDENLLDRLRDSSVPGVVIDTARGRAPARSESPQAATSGTPVLQRGARRAAAARARGLAEADGEAELRSLAPRTMAREFGLANRVAAKSRRAIGRVFLQARLGKAVEASAVQPVVEDIFASIQRHPHAFNGLMRCKRDTEFIYRHALAVCALMISLGRAMKLSSDAIRMAGTIGLLIDLGVGHLPLDGEAPTDFRDIDPALFSDHVRIGYDILTAGHCPEAVALACLHHHERIDGSGYPQGLAGDEISRFGRMAAICDSYDWLVDDSAGHAALDPAAAIEWMAQPAAGLDPELVELFTRAIGIHPIGSMVELASGRLAMVVAQDDDDPMGPRVRVFWSLRDRRALPPSDIALARCFGEDRIVGRAEAADLVPGELGPLRERLFAGACGGG